MAKPIGILGGTFDPVHNGHLRLALEVYQQLQLQEVRLIPVCFPPHRDTPVAEPAQRLRMLELSCQDTEGLIIDDCEIHRGGTSYTIDTVRLLHNRLPDQPLCLIIGMDAFQRINGWRNWQELLEFVHMVVVDRPGNTTEFEQLEIAEFYNRHLVEDKSVFISSNAGNIFKINVPMLEISATRIRHLIAEDKSIKYLLPDQVITYIETESIYK